MTHERCERRVEVLDDLFRRMIDLESVRAERRHRLQLDADAGVGTEIEEAHHAARLFKGDACAALHERARTGGTHGACPCSELPQRRPEIARNRGSMRSAIRSP